MSSVVEMPSFKIKNNKTEKEFLEAHEKFNSDFISKQDGYVSHKLMRRENDWLEVVEWVSLAAKEKAFEAIYNYDGLEAYMSFINQDGEDEDIPIYTLVKTY